MKSRYIDPLLQAVFGDNAGVVKDVELQITVLASAILVTGTTLVSPLISDLAIVFDVAETTAGLLIIVYVLTATICTPIGGVLADRLGQKHLLVAGLLLFGISGVTIILSPFFELILGLRVIQALGFSLAIPPTITIFAELYDGNQETMGQGLRATGVNVAIMLVPVLSGLLFLMSWRAPFVIFALAIPVALWAWVSLPRPQSKGSTGLSTYFGDLFEVCINWVISLLLFTFVLRFFTLYGFYTYITVLLVRDLGVGVAIAGTVVSIKGMSSIISSTQAGRFADTFNPGLIVLSGFVFTGMGVSLIGISPLIATVVLGTALFGFGDGVISPAQKSLINQLAPAGLQSGVISVATALQNVGRVLGPVAFGLALGWLSASTSFLLFGLFNGIVGICALTLIIFSSRYRSQVKI